MQIGQCDNLQLMRDLLVLAIHLIVTLAKLLRPGGVRAVAAESLSLKHQLLISNRTRQRAPNLTALDRLAERPLRLVAGQPGRLAAHEPLHTS